MAATYYYKQVDKATGNVMSYISYNDEEAPSNHPTIDYVPISEEEFMQAMIDAGGETEEGAEADAE